MPGLATEWKVDPKDNKIWPFALRKGVKFHDGSDFKANAVIWNLDKVLNDKSPQFDAKQSAQVRPRILSVGSYRKIDDYTVEMTTKDIDALFPYQLHWFLIGSPAQWEMLGRDWAKVATQPSGTGPFKLDKLVPRERADLVKNAAYWDKTRIPKTDRIVLVPILDALTRTNALLNGQVDLIETPRPTCCRRSRPQAFASCKTWRLAVMYAGRLVEENEVAEIVNRPRHHYTAGLLASTVDGTRRGRPLETIEGAPPDLSAPPAGFAFAPRCAAAKPGCISEQPPLLRAGQSALACWWPREPEHRPI